MNYSYFDTEEGREMVINSVLALKKIADNLEKIAACTDPIKQHVYLMEKITACKDPIKQYVYLLSYSDSDSNAWTTVHKRMEDAIESLRNEWYAALADEGVELDKFDRLDDETLAQHISQAEGNIKTSFHISEGSAYAEVYGKRAVFMRIDKAVIE